MSIAWQATARRRPLPVFRGVLEVRPLSTSADTAIVLDGVYRPPLRVLGAFGDGLVGHRLASGGCHPPPAPEPLDLPAIL